MDRGDDPIWDEGGLSKFDGAKFTDYTNIDAKSPGHNLGKVKFDAEGNAWMASDVGLLMFDGERGDDRLEHRECPDLADEHGQRLRMGQPREPLGHARRSPDREGWAGEVGRLDLDFWTTANGIPWGQPWDGVTSIEIDAQNNIYIGSEVLGVAKFNGTAWTWIVQSGWVNDLQFAPNGELCGSPSPLAASVSGPGRRSSTGRPRSLHLASHC